MAVRDGGEEFEQQGLGIFHCAGLSEPGRSLCLGLDVVNAAGFGGCIPSMLHHGAHVRHGHLRVGRNGPAHALERIY